MEEIYTRLAYLTAGVSLAMGFISLYVGIKNNNRTDLLFGLMALSLFTFLMLSPPGFIIVDRAPYSAEILVKRVFIFAYYCLMPWFIASYTGDQNRKVPILISIIIAINYVIMAFTREDLPKPEWVWIALMGFISNLVYGLASGIKNYKQKEKERAGWFLAAFSIYGVLTVITVLNQIGFDFIDQIFNVKLFFSIHLHALFLVFIMGLRIVVKVNEHSHLMQISSRWQSLMQHAPVFIMELDLQGKLTYINQYGGSLLGCDTAGELTGLNWFDSSFLPDEDRRERKLFFSDAIANRQTTPYFEKKIYTKKGDELIIAWTHFLAYAEDGEISGMICVGINTTDEENAKKLINQLKLELEKEKIIIPDDQPNDLSQGIIGKSHAIRYAIDKAKQVAKTSVPVLLEGETGVGKEVIADLIHKDSLRAHAPMVKVNCGALPKELIEDELFGHEKGAFTSAIQSRKGRFELAEGGTIFLDEIGELPLDMQPKLLRVLQNGEFQRVGGQKTIKVNVRVIVATNRDLAKEVILKQFREDLFYRLNVFPITIPPLRDRSEDLPLLINYFIQQKTIKHNKSFEQISKGDMQRMLEYPWPGNVRELINVIERSVIASEGNTLKLAWSVDESNQSAQAVTLEDIERQHIIKMMETCRWKINGENGAAEKLNMHPNTLRSKMKKLGISRPVKDIL